LGKKADNFVLFYHLICIAEVDFLSGNPAGIRMMFFTGSNHRGAEIMMPHACDAFCQSA
jgi:hypothetical protein